MLVPYNMGSKYDAKAVKKARMDGAKQKIDRKVKSVIYMIGQNWDKKECKKLLNYFKNEVEKL